MRLNWCLAKKVLNGEELDMCEILEASNIFSSITSGYNYKVAQIKSYDWISKTDIRPCLEILSENITADDVQYERCLDEQILKKVSIHKSTKELDVCLPAGSGTTVGVHRSQTPLRPYEALSY
jgi:hypothetical protein